MEHKILQVQNTSTEELLQNISSLIDGKFQHLRQQLNSTSSTVWLTKKDVAKLLSISIVTVDDWTRKNVLTTYRIGNRIRFKKHEVEKAVTQINNND